MLGAVATKQGILLATTTHYDIVPASYLTCLLPKSTIYGMLKRFIRSWWVIGNAFKECSLVCSLVGRGVLEHPKHPPPKYATGATRLADSCCDRALAGVSGGLGEGGSLLV